MENKIVNILVIFGATGDLASRKIFPAINEINKSGNIPENFYIIGCGRKEIKTNIFNDLSSRYSSAISISISSSLVFSGNKT